VLLANAGRHGKEHKKTEGQEAKNDALCGFRNSTD
jgi:hypothetical protein